ncbi:MAG: acyltransferase family protein [Methylocystaceae bacterium]
MVDAGSTAAANKKQRLTSLDALRGFDMFWIIGGSSIATGLVNLNLPWSRPVAYQLSHSPWNGFTFYDLIFPLFVFITGVSAVLSLQKRLVNNQRTDLIKHILKRTILLFLVGIIYYDQLIPFSLANIRIAGVLQRIAICYLICSLLIIYTRPRFQLSLVIIILIGYWAAMKYIPVPGHGAGVWTIEGNLARYVDSKWLPGRLFYGSWDPEGILTTIPAIATCLLGVLTGYWFMADHWYKGKILSAEQRAWYLFAAGIMLMLLGTLLSSFFPINKKLWTSSFVLLTGGLSCMLLASAYWLVDIKGYRIPAFPFLVIGMNSIFIYFAVRFVPFNRIASWVTGIGHLTFLGRSQALIAALIELSLEGLLLLYLYRKRVFIRL